MSLIGMFSVVIVNYNTPKLVRNCVQSVLDSSIAHHEDIVVVDNASTDNSFSHLKLTLPGGIRLVRTSINRGFAAGVNFGMVGCLRDLVLVLNPDTYFVDASLENVVTLLRDEVDVGLVGLDLIYPDGERQFSARRFYSLLDILGRRSPLGRLEAFKRRIDDHMMREAWGAGTPFEAEWVLGTGFVVRRSLYGDLGGMDEHFFLYMEDVDFCARIWQAGYRVLCVPGARLTHEHQRESASGLLSKAARRHMNSLWRFSRKYRVPLFRPPGVAGLIRGAKPQPMMLAAHAASEQPQTAE
ncbi:glycosyltransferase family 2 protein [Paraburkholderia rhynchosiae]|uniref:Glycosyl transferase family 2 n=1 Tax=Paraburkholderia rhynchosiae TaxID=487049 RepID=A0A2N7WNE5_9BURK|nr:glycosyltransferase family 2 protein [Paraburkholderia rhynchosiae]PMS30978.1 glycosyl transferase family 2 [Paraburkholderia rhynchosiae]CAB3704257.1 N-acetylglucosaminyl-diphospho-decaprenol L-rhamnosyltransferase [Paraburkholderia rhynchosiae]